MNLHINFIRPAEIRSASMVSVRAVMIMTGVFVPLVILLAIANAYISYAEKRSALQLAESIWNDTEKQKLFAVELNNELKILRGSMAELTGWRDSRLELNRVMLDIQNIVPPEIQLKVMQLSQSLELDEKFLTYRKIKLTLNGRCEGPEAEARVKMFDDSIKNSSSLRSWIKPGKTVFAQADTDPASDEADRAFQVDLELNPRFLSAAPSK